MDNIEKGKYKNLQDIKLEFDQNKMWSEIEISTRNKKRRFVMFWIFGILIFTLIGSLILNNKNHSSNNNITNSKYSSIPLNDTKKNIEIKEKISSQSGNSGNVTISSKKNTDKNLTAFSINRKSESNHSIKENEINHTLNTDSSKSLTTDTYFKNKLSTTIINKKNNFQNVSISIIKLPIYLNRILNDKIFDLRIPAKVKIKTGLGSLIFDAFVSYGFVSHDFTGENRSFSKRKDTETPLDEIGLGINISKRIYKGFYIKTGLNYYRITTKVYYNLNTIDNIVDLDSKDIPKEFIGREGIIIRSKKYTFFNRKNDLTIPILMGFQLKAKNSALTFEGGIGINIYSKYSGFFLNNALDFTKINQNINKSNIINYNVTFLYSKQVNNIQFYIGPSFRLIPSIKFNNYKENYKTLSVRFGIKI